MYGLLYSFYYNDLFIMIHHFMLVKGPVISGFGHYIDSHVMEESYGVIFQPHVWANVDVTIMICH